MNYYKSYPKPRNGSECKKVNCSRYKAYKKWECGTTSLNFCMECKWSHVSQYNPKIEMES